MYRADKRKIAFGHCLIDGSYEKFTAKLHANGEPCARLSIIHATRAMAQADKRMNIYRNVVLDL